MTALRGRGNSEEVKRRHRGGWARGQRELESKAQLEVQSRLTASSGSSPPWTTPADAARLKGKGLLAKVRAARLRLPERQRC